MQLNPITAIVVLLLVVASLPVVETNRRWIWWRKDNAKTVYSKTVTVTPNFQANITNTLLNVDQIHQGKQTELMKAYAIATLNDYFDEIADKEEIFDFVKAQLASDSPKREQRSEGFFEEPAAK